MAKKTITDKEFEILFEGTGGEIEIAGKSFPIYPFNVEQSDFVVKKIGVIIPIIGQIINDQGMEGITPAIIIGILNESMGGLIEVVAMCLNVSTTIVKRLDQGSFLNAILEIIRINKLFFESRVKVVLEELKEEFPQEFKKELTESQ